MLSKRDLQLVRLACSRRLISAEQGEEVLALKEKLGAKLSIEEILRRHRFVDAAGISELTAAANQVVSRRARPAPPPRAKSALTTEPPRPIAGPIIARRAAPGRGGASRRPQPVPRVEVPDSSDEPPEDTNDRTIVGISPGIEALRKAHAQAQAQASGRTPDGDRTAIDMSVGDIQAAVEAYKKERAKQPQTNLKVPGQRGLPAPTRSRIEVRPVSDPDGPQQERTVFDFRPDFLQNKPVTPGEPQVLKLTKADIVEADGEDDVRTVLGMSVADLEAAREDALAALPDSAILAANDTPSSVSMPGESLATLMLGAESHPGELETADGYQSASILEEGMAETLLGPFGRYVLERVIARGARSVVFLGTDSESKSPVAVKLLAGSPESNSRLLAAQSDALIASAQISSPHVVAVVDAGRVDGRYFLAMEYVEGWTLGDKLDADERLSLHDAIEIARDVARGLADAASVGLAHGHLEPDQVFLSEGRALVSGIGMGPMIAPGDLETPRRDLYALGAMLFRLATGSALGGEVAFEQVPAEIAPVLARLLLQAEPYADATDAAMELDQALLIVSPAPAASKDRGPIDIGPLGAKAILSAVGLIALAILGPLVLQVIGLADWSSARAVLRGALLGAIGLVATTILTSVLSLIRRGELPLPMSSAWLVRLQEGAGTFGALILVAGFSVAPPALLNLAVAGLSVIALGSGVFGWFLRRGVAAARSDRGVGRVLAVLGDPVLGRWRELHVPLTTALSGLACLRVALLAYFSAS